MLVKFDSIRRSIIATSLLALMASCGEKVPLEKLQSTFEVSYTGNLELGAVVQFQSSAPAGSDLLWKFSDGHVSIETSPQHIFHSLSHDGTTIVEDTVVLIVNSDIHQPNVRTFLLKPGVSKLVGNYTWQGGFFSVHGTCCPGFTDQPMNDTTFAVTATDDFTVNTWGADIPYLADSNYYSTERKVGRYNATMLTYTTDTLFFLQRSGDSGGWVEYSYFHKY